MKFRVLIEQDEDGKFIASCPTLPGCVSDGVTRDDAVHNMKDAIEGYLTSLAKSGDPIPAPIHEEIVEVNVSAIEEAA
ncbi:MAG: type II toxin-antitoxin system HicB family antitoxin [Phycisphaerales bacterium]|nr:type II toxin-antitoxin system HicB family antitoxin [Phycisphaerales bacterium]MCI0629434.1 type II toxin-antitoxin system HicB family antitoxin [Phycisphaerales bacterium]MCI0674984.1 type II toxin-antitoxin system HicB family antitoxin [Phycisphaerales bacterium]